MSEGSDQITMDTTAVDYYYEVMREGQAETETSSVGPAYTEEGPGEMGTSGFMERESRERLFAVLWRVRAQCSFDLLCAAPCVLGLDGHRIFQLPTS